MKKTSITPSVAIFFGFLFLCVLAFAVLPNSGYAEREKRFLAEPPTLSPQAVLEGSFQTELETWFADRFPFREFWVGVNSYLNLLEGRNLQNEVYYCRENYLINAPKPADLTQLRRNLAFFEEFATASGLPASLLPVPTAGAVNAALLPAGHPAYPDEAAFAEMASLCSYVNLMDPRAALTQANVEKPVYYRTDHHLTAWGSYQLYAAYSRAPRPATDWAVAAQPGFYGTTWSSSGYWLVPPDTLERWEDSGAYTVTLQDSATDIETHQGLFFLDHAQALDQYPTYLDGNHPLTIVENPASDGGVLLIVKDSYAHCFTTLAAGEYSKILLVDLRYYRAPVSNLLKKHNVTELLFLYGLDNLLTDTNAAWLT